MDLQKLVPFHHFRFSIEPGKVRILLTFFPLSGHTKTEENVLPHSAEMPKGCSKENKFSKKITKKLENIVRKVFLK